MIENIDTVKRYVQVNSVLTPKKKYIDPDTGWLINEDIPIGRTGIHVYKGFEFGKTGQEANRDFRMWRKEFSPQVLEGFRKTLTVTLSHPANGTLTTRNYSTYGVGNLGENVYTVKKGNITDLIAEKFIIKDHEAIDLVEKKGNRDVSIGFNAIYDFSASGYTPDGEYYDGTETLVSANHVAIVIDGHGKAGPEYKLNSIIEPPKEESTMDIEQVKAMTNSIQSLVTAINTTNENNAKLLTAVNQLTAVTEKHAAINEDFVARATKLDTTQTVAKKGAVCEDEGDDSDDDKPKKGANGDYTGQMIDKMKGKGVNETEDEDGEEKHGENEIDDDEDSDINTRPGVNSANVKNRKGANNNALKSHFKSQAGVNSAKDAPILTELYKTI